MQYTDNSDSPGNLNADLCKGLTFRMGGVNVFEDEINHFKNEKINLEDIDFNLSPL